MKQGYTGLPKVPALSKQNALWFGRLVLKSAKVV